MSLYEENERLLEQIEEAQARLEKIKLTGPDTSNDLEKREVAARLKACVSGLVDNIEASSGDVQALGGALILVDLLEILRTYQGIFEITKLAEQLKKLEKMWESSR